MIEGYNKVKLLDINKIYNEDFINIIKEINNNSINLIITDPPYKVVSRGSVGSGVIQRPKGVLTRNDGKLFNHTNIKISDWMPELYRILKEETHCYIFTNVLNLKEMLLESEKVGFKLHNILVWEKNNCTPSQFYMKNCEYILLLRKGKAKWINDIGGSKTVHKYNNIIGNKKHPTEKPVELLEFYINNSSNEGDLIFDPFMGSGSTAIACINSGRNYLGFEIDEGYYQLAIERVKNHKTT